MTTPRLHKSKKLATDVTQQSVDCLAPATRPQYCELHPELEREVIVQQSRFIPNLGDLLFTLNIASFSSDRNRLVMIPCKKKTRE